MNKNIFIIILILLMLSPLNVLAITYGKTGEDTNFIGDVNISLGSNYHRDEIPLSFIQSRNNATVPPTADDDSADGYEVNSVWTDIVGDRTYILVDATEGDAIWQAPFTMWVRADEAIKKGDPVYISGSLGAARPKVKLVDADLEVAHHMIGAAVQDIANGDNGFIRTSGAIKSVDTEGVTDANPGNEDWTPGDHLYATLDGGGGYTNVRPTSGMVILAAFTLLGDHDIDTILVVANVNDSDMASAASEDIRIRLGADDGSTDLHIKNFSDVLVASINDKGNADFNLLTVKNLVVTPVSQYPPAQSDTYVKATSITSATYSAHYATDPALLLTGGRAINSWMSVYGAELEQRFHIDLGEAKIVKRIYYEPFHDSGGNTNYGVRNFTFWGSNTGAGSFDDLVWGNDGGWTIITTSQSTFNEHDTGDNPDPNYITVANTTAYRYYAFKFADNYGYENYMGVRHMELQTAGEITTGKLKLEQVIEDVGTFTPTKKVIIEVNGVEYYIQLDPVL